MGREEYCKIHNLPTNRGLVGAITRDKLAKVNKDRMEREMDDEIQREKVKERLSSNNRFKKHIKDKQCSGCLKYFDGHQWQSKCDECIDKRKREYELNNKDIKRITSKAFYDKNKETESYKKKRKEYTEANKKKIKDWQVEYNKEYYPEYYKKNKEKIRKRQNEYNKEYYKKINPVNTGFGLKFSYDEDK